jgi:TetR/AcrR family transcriptional repressor of mexJK operon
MEEVARRAGVAKQTLYNYFGSKRALFQAIVEQICDELMGTVDLDAPHETPPEQVLGDFARRFVGLMVAPTSIGLFRLLAADAHRFPDLAETVFRSGPDRVVSDLARYLEAQDRAGRLLVPDARLSAESFMGSLRGNLEIKALFSGQPGLDAINADTARLDRYSRHCVEIFLAAHAAR